MLSPTQGLYTLKRQQLRTSLPASSLLICQARPCNLLEAAHFVDTPVSIARYAGGDMVFLGSLALAELPPHGDQVVPLTVFRKQLHSHKDLGEV